MPSTPSRTPSKRYAFAATPEGGVQVLHRGFELLRVIAAERGGGLRLTEIAERSQLHVATAHRLLRALEAERAVIYDPFERVYYIGYDFLQHSHETLEVRLKQHFHPLLQHMADVSHDTANLAIAHGLDALYIDVAHGQFPEGNLMVVGGRRPLGAGPASVVLLGALPLRRQHQVMNANAQRYLRFNGINTRQVRLMLQELRRDGYSFGGDNIVPGVSAVAVPVLDAAGKTVASIALSSSSERLAQPRQREIASWLKDQLARWEQFDAARVVQL